ncbi:MAG: efflux RND transporter periplasmic adaptor subunit [Planctomycetes bacterium]|nr:efflux RND transporter periplasmic adaptor subunit [Planctomycetota bacterium]
MLHELTFKKAAPVVFVFFLAACNPFSSDSGATSSKAASVPATSRAVSNETMSADRIRVHTEKPVRDQIASYLETTSPVEAVNEADLYPKTGGVVRSVQAEEGDVVKAGQVLAVLDQVEAQIQLKQAEIALEESKRSVLEAKLAFDEAKKRLQLATFDADQAKRDYERDAKLSTSEDGSGLKIVAPKVLEASKLAWDRAENNRQVAEFTVRKSELTVTASETNQSKSDWSLQLSKVRLNDTEIRSHFDGVVSARYIKLGETATMQTRIFKITDLEHLQTVFYRPQHDLRVLAGGGQDVEATCEALAPEATGKPAVFPGRVERIAPVVDPLSGSFKITASLQNRNTQLKPGLLVRVRVTLGKRENAYLIPKRARVLEGVRPYVFVVRDNLTIKVPIEEGYSDADRVEVRNIAGPEAQSGLRPDDAVVVIANVDLKEGLKVSVDNSNTIKTGG